ncbi:hypothetical protein [Sandarakinorhabdus sp.]|uniref:hypothetical protein n=1 Tax=Sandarakinorhabdus sp. TaxID=1916663 RepID=UPI003F7272AE
MRRNIEKTVNRISALFGVGALAMFWFDANMWFLVFSSWLVLWITLQLVGQGIATALEKRLLPPPYYLLVKPADIAVGVNDLERSDANCACCGARTLSCGANGDVVR